MARPGTNQLFTVANSVFISSINSPMIFQGDSQSERISGKLFDDKLISYMDKTVK